MISKQPDFYSAYWRKAELYLNWMGDVEKAREVVKGSYGKVDAAKWDNFLWRLEWNAGNYQGALSQATIPPWDTLSYTLYHGLMYYRMNELDSMRVYFESARPRAEELAKSRPDEARIHCRLGIINAGLGRKADAIREGNRALEIAARKADHWNEGEYLASILQIYVILNDQEKALQTLETLLTEPHDFGLSLVFVFHDFAPLLDYPGLEHLVDKYGNSYAKALWEKHKRGGSS